MRLVERLRLRFADPAKEALFRTFYCLRFRHHTRIALVAGALLITLFAASDWLLDREGARMTVVLRLVLIVPLMLASAWAVMLPRVERLYESVATLVACLVAALLAIIYWRLGAPIRRWRWPIRSRSVQRWFSGCTVPGRARARTAVNFACSAR